MYNVVIIQMVSIFSKVLCSLGPINLSQSEFSPISFLMTCRWIIGQRNCFVPTDMAAPGDHSPPPGEREREKKREREREREKYFENYSVTSLILIFRSPSRAKRLGWLRVESSQSSSVPSRYTIAHWSERKSLPQSIADGNGFWATFPRMWRNSQTKTKKNIALNACSPSPPSHRSLPTASQMFETND